MSAHRPPAFAFHHVQLAMPHGAEAAARFYAGVLGLAEIAKPPALTGRGGVWFRAGALELHLGVDDDFRPARKAHPAILVEDLDGLAAHLQAHDIQVRPDANLPGYRRFYLDDCFGNRLEFLSPSNDTQTQADPVMPTR
jgi:catechol 2,3-dioxygenase-like lactoylglutathione lyase family enzyme